MLHRGHCALQSAHARPRSSALLWFRRSGGDARAAVVTEAERTTAGSLVAVLGEAIRGVVESATCSVGRKLARAAADNGDNTLVGVPTVGNPTEVVGWTDAVVISDDAETPDASDDSGDGGVFLVVTGERNGGTGACVQQSRHFCLVR